jgi:hypothetical protein
MNSGVQTIEIYNRISIDIGMQSQPIWSQYDMSHQDSEDLPIMNIISTMCKHAKDQKV